MTPDQKERRLARLRERYATDPAYKARVLEQQRGYRKRPEYQAKQRERAKRWATANREHLRNKRAEWYAKEMEKPANRESSRRRARAAKFRQYGLDEGGFRAILFEQGGVCCICGETNKGRRLDIDHDHATGLVRGLLCHRCNLGLGYFLDRPDLLRGAIDYLTGADEPTKEAAA